MNIISETEYHSLFPNTLLTITKLNHELFKELEIRYNNNFNNNTSIISDILINFAPYFKMYQLHMNNHESAFKTLSKLKEKNNFEKCIDERRIYFDNLNLGSLLILPVQRLLRIMKFRDQS